MRLRSKRVYLRRPANEDFDGLAELYRSSRRHFRGVARSRFDSHTFDRILEEAATETNEYFLVCRLESNVIMGVITLSQIFRKSFQNAYLGYMLGSGFTGKGYMTEAVKLALGFAFRDLKLHRIEANVQPTNSPSIKVLERSGFTKEGYSPRYLKICGRWRDHERWAILKEDWKPNTT